MKSCIPGMLRCRGEKVEIWLARLLHRLRAFSRLTCRPLWLRLAWRLKEALRAKGLSTASTNSESNSTLHLCSLTYPHPECMGVPNRPEGVLPEDFDGTIEGLCCQVKDKI